MVARQPAQWPVIGRKQRAEAFARVRALQLRQDFALTPAQRIQQLDDLVAFERILATHRPEHAKTAPRSLDERAWVERRRR